MDRRTFFNLIGLGLLAHSMPVALAACSSKNTDDAKAFRQIGTTAELEKEGKILNQTKGAKPVLVVRDSNTNALVAVNPTCTHRDCIVNWNKQQNVFLCSCHDSKFDTTGKVLSPPAEDPLYVYKLKTEGDLILVSNSSTSV